MDSKYPEKISFVISIVSLFLFFLTFLIGKVWVHSEVIQLGYLFSSVLCSFSILSFLHYRLLRLEQEEEIEEKEVQALYERDGLFDQEGTLPSIVSTRSVIERYVIPVATGIVGVLFAVFSYYKIKNWQHLSEEIQRENPLGVAGVLVFLAVFCLLGGSYLEGLSLKQQRWLRPLGHWLRFGALLYGIAIFAMIGEHIQGGNWDIPSAIFLGYLFIILGVELAVNVLVFFFRPPTEVQFRPPFEGIVLGLITNPERISRRIAFSFQYQFGIHLSKDWFSTVVKQYLLPGVFTSALFLYLLDCVVKIDIGEQGIKEAFGVPQKVLRPGIHFKFPRPFHTVRIFSVSRVHSIYIGGMENKDHSRVEEEDHPDEKEVILWNKPHYHQNYYLVASEAKNHATISEAEYSHTPPAEMIASVSAIFYTIDNIHDYAYNYQYPDKILQEIASRELNKFLASKRILSLLSDDRLRGNKELEKIISQAISAMNPPLGITIEHVGLLEVHPPVDIASTYQELVASHEKRRSSIVHAEGYQQQQKNKANGIYHQRILEAEAHRFSQNIISSGETARFQKQLDVYHISPNVYRTRLLLEVMEKEAKGSKKYIIASSANEVITIDLQPKLRPDLLEDIELPEER